MPFSSPRFRPVLFWLGFSLAATAAAQSTPPVAPAAAAPAAPAAPADPVVLTVGALQLKASQFDALLHAVPAEQQAAMMANKRQVAEQLGKMIALAQEAQRRGLDKDPAFEAHMMLDTNNALASEMVQQLQKETAPTDAQIKAYYDAHPADFFQYKVRHILIGDSESPNPPNPRSQADAAALAQQVEARLKAGEDFAAVAKSVSDDPGSKAAGGELGMVTPGQTVPEFEAAVAALPIGQVSQPVHTQFGFHIIQVESKSPIPLDQAKPLILQKLGGQGIDARVDQIAAAAKVTLNDSYFGPATATTPHR